MNSLDNFTFFSTTDRLNIRSLRSKTLGYLQIFEISCLILILFEHTFIFLLTFKRNSSKQTRSTQSIIFLSKSFLYSCLHRNWIRALSFSNLCLSIISFLFLILKHFHPNLVQHTSPTLYSLPLNLLEQLTINFMTFHLLIISIDVLQYFLRYYRLWKTTYSSYFFNNQTFLLTKYTNVTLILSSSLALIFAYNFVFYNPKDVQTKSFLPLITLNMICLPLINLMIFMIILICCLIDICLKFNSRNNDEDNLRDIIKKNTCIKCYTNILEINPNLFQDKNSSYRHLGKHFSLTNLRSSFTCPIKSDQLIKISSENDLSHEQETSLFNRRIITKLNHQCHVCYYLLLIFLFKYILLTFPQHLNQMSFYSKQFYYFTWKKTSPSSLPHSFYEHYSSISHLLFLFSRFGDSLLLIRLPYLIKKYFPCWCQFNTNLLHHHHHHQEQIPHQILRTKTSDSSTNERISMEDRTNSNEIEQQHETIENKSKHRRYRLQFQFIPLWSRNRPRLFRESA